MTTLASDSFSTGTTLSGSWTFGVGEWTVASGLASAQPDNDRVAAYTAITWPNDQYSSVTLGSTTSSGVGVAYGVLGRATLGGTGNYYRLVANASGWELARFNSNSYNFIANSSATTFTSGDILTLELRTNGANCDWTVKKNGSTVTSGTGSDNSPLTSGSAGIAYSSTDATATGIDAWEGGDFSSSGYTITANQGSYSLTGQTANLARAYVPMAANQGSYGLTGQDATLSYVTTRTLPADYGLYTLVGSEALVDLAMNAEQGEYDLNGQVVILDYAGLTHRTITAEQGSYSLTGQDINMFWAHVLQALQGTYNLTGTSVILRWSEEASAGGIVLVQAITITKLKIGL